MGKDWDGPIYGRMVFTGGNPMIMRKEGGMSMRKDDDDTVKDYINATEQQRASTADNVPKGMLPGRVERKRKKRRSKRT